MRARSGIHAAAGAAVILFATLGAVGIARADEEHRYQVSLMGGMQALNHEGTGLPKTFVDIPATASLAVDLGRIWAVDGEFSWVIPVSKNVNLAGGSQDRKTPDLLSYQANAVARWPRTSGAWAPYLTTGLGAVRFLRSTDPDRLPQLSKSETDFAINFGGGTTYDFGSRWGLRADFRELAAFPSKTAAGFSSGGKADAIWMERAAIGVAYRI